MPSLQVVDTTERAPEPTGVQKFFSNISQYYKDKEDKSELNSILSEYEKNRENANAWEDLQLGLEKSNISPSKRIEVQNRLNETRKVLTEKDKAINDRYKKLEDVAKEKRLVEEKKQEKEKKEKEAVEKSEKTAAEVEAILLNGGESPEEAKRLSTILSPTSANARIKEANAIKKEETKKNEKKLEEKESTELTQAAYNRIAELIPKAGRFTSKLGYFGGENAKTAGEFTSLTGALEALLVEKVNKGALSNTRFKYITETLLPKVDDSQEEIKGKMKGLAIMLNLDGSAVENLDKKTEKKKENKVPEGKVRVKVKGSNPPVYGTVTPYEGMESKYDIVK